MANYESDIAQFLIDAGYSDVYAGDWTDLDDEHGVPDQAVSVTQNPSGSPIILLAQAKDVHRSDVTVSVRGSRRNPDEARTRAENIADDLHKTDSSDGHPSAYKSVIQQSTTRNAGVDDNYRPIYEVSFTILTHE